MRPAGRPVSRAVIIAVGTELLTPHKVDTNSLFLTEQLNAAGITVRQKLVVGDDPDDLVEALRHGMRSGDLVVVTGGLGPTEDDLTRETVAQLLGLPLAEDKTVLESMRARFAARRLEMPAINRCQAQVPTGAIVLANPHGTAPGLWIEQGGTVVVLLPGPPRELRPMFRQLVVESLADRTDGHRIHRRVMRITGRTESHVETMTYPIYSSWRPPGPSIETTILSTLGQVELHLSTRATAEADARRVLDVATDELAAVLGHDLFSSDGRSLEAVVGQLLRDRGLRLAVAESCTGGLITSRLTDVPGSSAYLHAGWTVYSDVAKVSLLGIAPRLIREHGAVSESVAEAMAAGARARADVDVGVGVTGIAGPGGGTEDKPVGTVCLALDGPEQLRRVRRLQLPGERDRVKFQASQSALDMVRRVLLRHA